MSCLSASPFLSASSTANIKRRWRRPWRHDDVTVTCRHVTHVNVMSVAIAADNKIYIFRRRQTSRECLYLVTHVRPSPLTPWPRPRPRYIVDVRANQNEFSGSKHSEIRARRGRTDTLLSLWPWPDDLDVRPWPRYSEDVPACQKWSHCITLTMPCSWVVKMATIG